MSNQQQLSAVEIAPTSAIKRKVVNMPSPRAVRWEQKEGNMKRFEFTLQEFWERSLCSLYNTKTGKRIDDKVMLANKDLEVVSFEPKSSYDARLKMWVVDGIAVTLESEDDE